MKKQSVAKGALILIIGGVIAKLFGAIYRIPLTHVLGAQGMGLYQMIFPTYALLLSISSGGIPTAVARLVSERLALGRREEGGAIARTALTSLAVVGAIGALAVVALSGPLARWQGNPDARLGYLAIAPSVFLVALISALRGYFQGTQCMTPTALSQIVEQAVKLVAGLALAAVLVPYGTQWGVLGATAGVTASELAAVVMLAVMRLRGRERLPVQTGASRRAHVRQIYSLAIPMTVGGIVLPLSQIVDSAMVVNLLAPRYGTQVATALYGIASGTVGSLVNMPVVITLAIASAVLPSVTASFALGDRESVRKQSGAAVRVAVALTLPCTCVLALFARPVIALLYGGGLTVGVIDEPSVAAGLLTAMSACVVLLGLIQVATALLQAVGRVYLPVLALGIGAAAKLAVNAILLPRVGIYAVAVSNLTCYAVCAAVDLIVLCVLNRPVVPVWRGLLAPALATALTAALGYGVYRALGCVWDARWACVAAIGLGAVCYVLSLLALGGIGKDEWSAIPVLGRATGFLRRRTRRTV